ncbi:VOC family protein [Kribbella sandramycini]|uniref:Putative glyoxalase superfamily protein PhnB n=1 Tax=Kribbella sandramycini TaxID=60450 RepID=A0A7Y4P1C6_9ACTN|nr:VOC family protein [Kribbella sandramycini]MBB6571466.1 putative glyoxalase superfamily protein PhnB [Kribbella sandramycini]NOL44117.1 VOC family protein [Kribbella sandramycini]
MTTTQQFPGGKAAVTPYVVVKGAARFLEFVEQTFEVKRSFDVPNQDGTLGHAEITVGGSVLMAFDAQPDWPDTPAFLSVFVADVDAVLARALDAGATLLTPMAESRVSGDRGCRVTDPLGNIWWLQTHLYDVNPADLQEVFSDPAELAKMKVAIDTFADEMRSRA